MYTDTHKRARAYFQRIYCTIRFEYKCIYIHTYTYIYIDIIFYSMLNARKSGGGGGETEGQKGRPLLYTDLFLGAQSEYLSGAKRPPPSPSLLVRSTASTLLLSLQQRTHFYIGQKRGNRVDIFTWRFFLADDHRAIVTRISVREKKPIQK